MRSSLRLRDHILRKGRARFPEATHLVDLLPVSLNMLCSLLKQRLPCCWSPPWGHPAHLHCFCRFPSCKAHLKGQFIPGTFAKNPCLHWPFGFCILSTVAGLAHSFTLFFAAVCCFLWVAVGKMGRLWVFIFTG